MVSSSGTRSRFFTASYAAAGSPRSTFLHCSVDSLPGQHVPGPLCSAAEPGRKQGDQIQEVVIILVEPREIRLFVSDPGILSSAS